MRFLPVGPRALLVERDDLEAALALFDALQASPVPGVAEIVPAARTLMRRTEAGVAADAALAAEQGKDALAERVRDAAGRFIQREHTVRKPDKRYADDSPEAAGRKAAKHIYWPFLWCWRCDRMG